ncbi:MAG TPA: hypothetical protein PK156_23465 [Polyangium sp.]|nr:hypothetical protein [Polyangium sp.]
MPPHRPKHHHDFVPSTAIRSLLSPGRIEPLLAPFVRDPADRAFVSRCILEQGPVHHRGANFALLSLVAVLLERTGGFPDKPGPGKTVAVPLRIPPHLAPRHEEDNAYPLQMPLTPLEVVVCAGAGLSCFASTWLRTAPTSRILAEVPRDVLIILVTLGLVSQLFAFLILAGVLTGLFSAGPSMAALLEVAASLAKRLPPSAVYVGLALSVCAGSSLFLTAATSGPLAQALTERADLRDAQGRRLTFVFFDFLPTGLLGFAVIEMVALVYAAWVLAS